MKSRRDLALLVRIAIIGAALAATGATAVGVVDLPSQANEHAVTSTSEVTTGQPSGTPSATATPTPDVTPTTTPAGTPAAQASFGQCVATNAKTASENGGQGWNPTQGCTKSNAHGGNPNAADNAAAGADNAGSHP